MSDTFAAAGAPGAHAAPALRPSPGVSEPPSRFAVFSDVHGNLPALRACLDDMAAQGVAPSYCCGDIVGYGARPNECMALLRDTASQTVLGNHDRMAISLENLSAFNEAARGAIAWTARTLAPVHRERIATLPLVHRVGALSFVHAAPFEPSQWHYVLTERAARLCFRHIDGWICFIGHSHQPFVVALSPLDALEPDPAWHANPGAAANGEAAGDAPTWRDVWYSGQRLACAGPGEIALDPAMRYLVNVGSVGQPRDLDPRACYVTVDLAAQRLRFHRVEYPVDEAQQAIIDAGLPVDLARRLAIGR